MTSFERRGVDLRVLTTAEFIVKLGPVVLYRYRHDAAEYWKGPDFASIGAVTNQNGQVTRVSATRGQGRVTIVTASAGTVVAPASALPFTHWNRLIASAPLFNPQDGKLLRESVLAPSRSTVRLASGATAPAERIVFRGDAYIEDYYGADGGWIALVGRLTDGSRLEYRQA